MAGYRILVIEDDPQIRSGLRTALEEEGYQVAAEEHGMRIDQLTREFRPDLAILDVGLPVGPDGYGLARRIRELGDIPLLFLTAADGLEDRLAGFEAGGDDYMVKPFLVAELLARVHALLRRSGRLSEERLQAGDLAIDVEARAATRAGRALDLTRTEFELLSLLVRHPGKVFSKVQLLTHVWGFEGYDTHVVEVHLSTLRRKLEAHGPRLVHTVARTGYVLRP